MFYRVVYANNTPKWVFEGYLLFAIFAVAKSSFMNFTGITIAIVTFFVIGVFHPIVIKSEYHFGTRCWWVFAVLGVAFIVASLWVEHGILSLVLGVLGCSCLWSILELFEQKKRVEKRWFPKKPCFLYASDASSRRRLPSSNSPGTSHYWLSMN